MVLALASLAGCGSDQGGPAATGLAALPAPVVYTFVPGDSAVLPGKSSADPTDSHSHAADGVGVDDQLGQLGIAALWSGKTYYRKGTYNDTDWPVSVGTLKGAPKGVIAFRVEPAQHPATKWVASKHGLFWRFDAAVDHVVFELTAAGLNPVWEIQGTTITPATERNPAWHRLGDLHISNMSAARTFAIAPKSLSLDPFRPLGAGVVGANLGQGPLGTHVQLRVSVPDTPVDSLSAFSAGPASAANRYGQNRRFVHVFDGERHGVVWQAPASGMVFVTRLSADLQSATTHPLTSPKGHVFAGATGDGAGALFVLYVQAGTQAAEGTRTVFVRRYAMTSGGVVEEAEAALDAAKKGLNITVFGTLAAASNQVAMRYSQGTLGVLLARKMHKASDGLNHQGAISFVLDATSLALLKNHGQSSGHSFENVLTVDSAGRFVGVDLGDNYPRGVHLHRFDAEGRTSRVVYTFKTKHGASAKNPAGKTFAKYEAASTADKTLYQWSNDNSTYTELGGVVETAAGLLVVFASEADKLDNAQATGLHNAPRNVGAVLVRSDFEAASKGKSSNWVTDDLVTSTSDYTMEGGYYSFGGKWLAQRNKGVQWHTSYTDKARNASRLKVVTLPGKPALVLWEEWTAKAYVATHGLVLNDQGAVQTGPVPLGTALRFGRRDDPFVVDGKVVCVRGSAEGLVVDVLIP